MDYTITLPKTLVEKLEKHMNSAGFSSINAYITTLLRYSLFDLEKAEEEKQ